MNPTPRIFPNGWYAGARPDGSYVVLIRGSHFDTSEGPVPLSPAGELLQITLGPQRRFAGHGHDDDNVWEWMPNEGWKTRGPAIGPRSCIYAADGTLVIVRATGTFTGSQGWRYVDDAKQLVASWETYDQTTDRSKALQIDRLWEWIAHGDVVIGQGDVGKGDIIARYHGTYYIVGEGQCTFAKFERAGDQLALAWVREDTRSAAVLLITVADLLTCQERPAVQPPPIVVPPPPPAVAPGVTISAYPTSVEINAPARAVAVFSGGPIDRVIWLYRFTGASTWRIAAVNDQSDVDHSYHFSISGDWDIAVRVEGPGGSDQTAARRVIRVSAPLVETPAPPPGVPPPPPARSPRFWFNPTMGSADLVQLFTEPDRWARARARVGVFGLAAQNVQSVGPIGPNTYAALVAAAAFPQLQRWGIPLALEMGSLKEWDLTGEKNLVILPEILQVVRAAGGRVTYVSMDEPLTSAFQHGVPLEAAADIVARFIRLGRSLGVDVGWLEAWPEVALDDQRHFLMALDARGARPAYWHLDLDRHRAQQHGQSIPEFLRAAALIAGDRDLPLGVFLVGYPHPTDAAYAADVLAWAGEVHAVLPDLAHVCVQSWVSHTPFGPLDLPRNLDESEQDSHTGLLLDVVGLFR